MTSKLSSLIVLLFLIVFSSTTYATSECPTSGQFQDKACDGMFVAKSMTDILTYKQTLGFKNNKIKSLAIDFNLVSTSDLSISTKCGIKLLENRTIKVEGKLCLHGENGIRIDSSSKIFSTDLKLESDSRISLSENTEVKADNFIIESREKAIIGSNSNLDIDNLFGMYTVGGNDKVVDSIIKENSKIKAKNIEIVTNEELKLGSNVRLDSTDLTLNAKECKLKEERLQISAINRYGSCFLRSYAKHSFTVDKNSGFAPLTINFDASKIDDAKYFMWEFGDGQTLLTSTNKVSHLYSQVGTYSAKLKYAKDYNPKNKKYTSIKSAGYIQIEVKNQPNLNPISNLSCSVNNLLVLCNGLSSFDPEGYPLTYKFIYGDNFTEENTTGLSTHAFLQAGLTTVQLIVSDNLGASSTSSVQVMPVRPDNLKYKEVLTDYVKVFKEQFIYKNNSNSLIQSELKKKEIEYCIQSILLDEAYSNNIQSAFYILIFNSDLRHRARMEIDSNLSGAVTDIININADKSTYCDSYKTR